MTNNSIKKEKSSLNDAEVIWDLIESFRIAMVTTIDDGFIRARPMAPFVDRDETVLRFLTPKDTHKLEEIEEDCRASVQFSNTITNEHVSLSGEISFDDDPDKVEKLWGVYADTWFAGGPRSGEITVMTFRPERGEYWDGTFNVLKAAWELGNAYAKEDKIPDIVKNRKVNFG
jgi:general stress protein 26